MLLIDPAGPGRVSGNRVTALRWALLLRRLGLRVVRRRDYGGERADLLVALHAVKSAPAVAAWRAARPGAPVVVAVTGTDLHDPAQAGAFAATLAAADALVVLHAGAAVLLPASVRGKVHVILQSVELPPDPPQAGFAFDVCVLANLRAIKRPLLAAEAAEFLPASSRVRVALAGASLDPELAAQARARAQRGHRFAWLGALPRARALRLLQGSQVLVSSSVSEGGANAVGEALVAGVPPLVTAIPGSLGLLGADWLGQFPVDDARALADLLQRCEREAEFLADLRARTRALAPQFDRARELAAWRELVRRLLPHCALR